MVIVLFGTELRADADLEEYQARSRRMNELVRQIPGFISIALLATPVLVLTGAVMGAPLDLNFSLLEVAIFGLVAGLYALISLDGESTWLEGVLLCAFYLILGVSTFFAPA
jgi:calcium/proton exchanger cax